MSDEERNRILAIHVADQEQARKTEQAELDAKWLAMAQKVKDEHQAWETRTKRNIWALGLLAGLVFAMALWGLTGCTSGYIRAEAVDAGMRKVIERHDRYVRADPTLNDVQKETYLTTSKLVLRVLDEAKKDSEDPDAIETQDQGPPAHAHLCCDASGSGPCGCEPEEGITCTIPCTGCCPRNGCAANVPHQPGKGD